MLLRSCTRCGVVQWGQLLLYALLVTADAFKPMHLHPSARADALLLLLCLAHVPRYWKGKQCKCAAVAECQRRWACKSQRMLDVADGIYPWSWHASVVH